MGCDVETRNKEITQSTPNGFQNDETLPKHLKEVKKKK